MMFMLGLMSSCIDAFFLTYPNMALLPPDRGTNFLIWKQIKTGRRGFPFPRTWDYLLLLMVRMDHLYYGKSSFLFKSINTSIYINFINRKI